MAMRRVGVLALSLAAALAGATVLCRADDPKKADPVKAKEMSAQDKDAALADLAMAFELADVGKRAGSPEALVGAAKILSRLQKQNIGLVQLDVQPGTGKADA